jgi:uncharacterized repeat protein (TIGR04052 family)
MRITRWTFTLLACAALAGCNGGDDDGGNKAPTNTPTTIASPTPTPQDTATTAPTPTATATATATVTATETPSPSPSPTTAMSVSLQFRPRVGDETFSCDKTFANVGTSAASLTPADFRLFVSDFRLVTEDGTEVPLQLDQELKPWQLDDLAFLDFENKTGACFGFGTTQTNAVVVGTVPTAEYTGVKFAMGVPFERNHGNQATAPDPLSVESMFWSWQSGYKFLRIDTFDTVSSDEFRIHLGSTGCLGQPPVSPVTSCSRPNRAEVELGDFDPLSDSIIVDLGALLADSDIQVNTEDTPPGCMSDPSDPECDPIFANLGISREDGTSDPSQQKFFRVEKTDLEHGEIFVGSTQQGGGKLIADIQFPGALGLFLNECIDGEGEHCDGGTLLYSAVTPGVEPLAEEDPEASKFKLDEAASVSLEITNIEAEIDGAAVSVQIEDQIADAVGEALQLGAGDFHADITTQLLIPGGDHHNLDELRLSFRLTTDSEAYEASDEFGVRFVALDEEGGGHHDDDDDHERDE